MVLLLPGMTLNATIFPDFGMPTVSPDFTRLVLSDDGTSDDLARNRMRFYTRRLDEHLSRSAAWSATPRIVVGHSFGGMLALEWLSTRPLPPLARIDGLVLVATTAGPMFEAVRLRVGGREGGEVRVPVRPLLRAWYHPLVTRAVAAVAGGPRSAAPVDFRSLRRTSDLSVGLAGWRNTDWRARRAYRAAMEGFDVRDRLAAIDVPAIVLHGTRDTFFAMGVARDLASRLPKAQLRVVRGAAHLLPLTHGEELQRAVRDLA